MEHIDSLLQLLILIVLSNYIIDKYKMLFNLFNVGLMQYGIIRVFIGIHEYNRVEILRITVNCFTYPMVFLVFTYTIIVVNNMDSNQL
jgi:hypothetical protein